MPFKNKGYTLVELLVSLVIMSIFFATLMVVTNNALRSYRVTRSIMQTLYASSSVSLLFDIMENELKWSGSGANLLKGLKKPDETEYTEITNRLWLNNSIDVEKTENGFAIYVTYILTYPVTLRFVDANNNGVYESTIDYYTPISKGYMGHSDWSIVKNVLSPSASNYRPKYTKLYFELNGSEFQGGIVEPGDVFTVKEINLSTGSLKDLDPLNADISKRDTYIIPIVRFENAIFNTGYFTRSFRQVKIEYDSERKEIIMERFIPELDLSEQHYHILILDNVEEFQGSFVYYESGILKEFRFDNRDDWNTYKNSAAFSVIKNSIIGMKFHIVWKPSWEGLAGETALIERTRFISLLSTEE